MPSSTLLFLMDQKPSIGSRSRSLSDRQLMAEIELKTAPADFRFPTTNQTRHCFTRYIEFHRCLAAKAESGECEKFAKYYRSICPGEWVDRWNEQREYGSFPGPL
ncbi:cytochrome c oxidase subunit 6b-2-like [Juglans regia]|uniref:Cytochrome c oxidase subunit 6b-2-like n=1 Tax=Juglans regia TaxID=51240 RepID=A0A6P9EVM7_JUGRE|nr:cytochrome c oxidase subunit 6b-2-like [Juglans regia]